MDALIRDTEGDGDQPFLLWDTVTINDVLASSTMDWVLAGPNEPNNSMGLQALHALHTAITLQLFTHRRAESYDIIDGKDPKGWWGDAVDLQDGEEPIGSRLWLLYRAPLDADTERNARDYCHEALQPLITQGAVARFVISTERRQSEGWLVISILAYSQDGQLIYDQKFSRLWAQEFSWASLPNQ